ncbi:hypothetical protein PENSPDRAFT_146283 [Peniophora sp. CONT]|nr:hypothetical protein PENSPDRAFT_146283 [Peniophora sp. CONT]
MSSLTVHSLPDDALYAVFTWLSLLDVPGFNPRSSKVELGWIASSHVCERWRDVITSMPLLWAKMAGGVFTSQETCDTIIKRAGNAPLHLWNWHRIEGIHDYPVRSLH